MILRFGVHVRADETTDLLDLRMDLTLLLAAQTPEVTIDQLRECEAMSSGIALGELDVCFRQADGELGGGHGFLLSRTARMTESYGFGRAGFVGARTSGIWGETAEGDPMDAAKAQAETLLKRLPDDCTYDDIHYHLYVIEKIHRGLESADKEGTISQEEMETRLEQWFSQ